MNIFRIILRLFSGASRRSTYRPQRRWSSSAGGRPSQPQAQVRTISVRAEALITAAASTETFVRGSCWVVDGDTIIVNNVRLRLAGIDAPELDHPYGKQSKWVLFQLCKGQVVTARIKPESSYDRVVAECFLPDGRDLAAELVRAGLALDWPRFSGGKYRHLEPPGARKKLWRCDARQRGRLVTQGTF